ncbi:MAG TPA: nuclear transport factor 2 family protein [Acidimicrobiales bacterium]|nr:nuclear transport factor 2 family protein [Acidimicrobiales bacterium]
MPTAKEEGEQMVLLSDLQSLVAGWWFDYDQGNFDAWPGYFTADARFSCRSDSRATAFEEFVTADVRGRDAVLAWNTQHRKDSPYPLRHNGTNIHVVSGGEDACRFRSYIFVTQIVGMGVSPLASGVVVGAARREDGELRFSEMEVVLDFTDSHAFNDATRFELF